MHVSRSFLAAGLYLVLAAGLAPAQNEILYSSDFEADDGGFSPTSEWEHGIPTSGPGAAHSGSQCWGTNLDGPSSVTSWLTSPSIDATPAATADGILVSWWQYIDDAGIFVSFVTASSAPGVSQHLFGMTRIFASTALPHVGWRRMSVVLGREYATDDLKLSFRFEGVAGTDGQYVDDVSVEVLRATTVSLEDFESGMGGFVPQGTWSYGAPTNCPVPTSAASGSFCWGTSLSFCSYPPVANDAFLSPVVDLTPYANRREVYLRWNRFASLESVFDGIHHELSFDGGTTWEIGAGFHVFAASGLFDWTGFGFVFEPAVTPSVRLRLRLTSDDIDQEYGSWFDDFELAVPEVVTGSGANPPDSLRVSAGSFGVGRRVSLDIDDPSGAFGAGALGVLAIAMQPDASLPTGTSIPGWGMSAPGTAGDLLIDPGSLVGIETGSTWSPGQPSQVSLRLPSSPALVGTELWLQAVLVDTSGVVARFGLTNGLFERL